MSISEENRLNGLSNLLNTNGRKALQTRISFALDESSFLSAMEAEKTNLERILPISMMKKIYTEKEEKPSPLKELSLRPTIMICFILPQLKEHFKSEEREALVSLNAVLLNLFNALFRLRNDDKIFEGVVNELTEETIKTLSSLGLSESNLKENLAELVKKSSNDGYDNKLFDDLQQDELIVMTHFKMVAAEIHEKQAYKESLPTWLEECAEKIHKIKQNGKLDLDGFFNIKKSVQKCLEMILKCGFCKDALKDPRTFPCLHSFCLSCIKQHSSDKVSTCPVCSTRVAVGEGKKIEELPLSFTVAALMKLLDMCKKSQEDDIECKICIEPPTLICLNCAELYCRNHGSSFFHENHCVAPLAELVNAQNVIRYIHRFCPQHKKELTQYCPACLVPLCSTPICVTWHGQHSGGVSKLSSLTDAIEEQSLRALDLNQLLKKKMERVDAKIESLEQSQMDVANLQENIRESVVHFFADIDTALQKAKQAYLRDLDKAADHCMQSDEQTRQVLQAWKSDAQALDTKLQSLMDDVNGHQKMTSVTELTSLRNRTLTHLSDTGAGATIADSKGISYPESGLRNLLQQVLALNSQLIPTVHNRGWEPVIKLPGMKYFLTQKNNLYVIKRLMIAGHQLVQYDLKNLTNDPILYCESNLREFQSVAIDNQGMIYIPEDVQNTFELPSFRMKRYINLAQYGANKIKVAEIPVTHLNTYSKTIFKSAGKYLYIGDNECVCELKPDGELVRKFNFVNMINVGDFAIDPLRDMLFITDSLKHSFMIFDCKQQTMITIGEQGPGVTPDSFNYPTGVTVDPYGHLFVADSGNARVQVFEINGKFTKLIQFPLNLKETITSNFISSPSSQKTVLQVHEDYLYMLDSSSDTLWRIRYF